MLSANAYNEILQAARMWDAQRMGVGASRGDYMSLKDGVTIRFKLEPDGSLTPTGI